MFDLADTSGDGLLSREEFLFYMKEHTNHTKKMIRDAFDMIDVDGNGDISRDEVRNAFLSKRRNMQGGGSQSGTVKSLEDEMLAVSRDADALFDKADVDKNGTLTKAEFELFMKRHTDHTTTAIEELFDSMDENHDGFITREEVRKAYLDKKVGIGGGKLTLMDLLGLEDEDVEELEDDVYSMFFLADLCGHSYWFAILVWFLKLGLIFIIAIDLYTTGVFPDSSEVPALVKTTQFLLLPVNVAVQEELITTFFIYANLKWSREILDLSPGASKVRFWTHGLQLVYISF